MEIQVGGRRSGKTRAVVRAFKSEPEAVLLVATEQERQRIIEFFGLSEDQQQRVITPHRRDRLFGVPRASLYIDNLDWILHSTYGVKPVYATITTESNS